MTPERCPDDVANPSCREVAAAAAHEIEGSSFTQSYRLDAILEPLLPQRVLTIHSAYAAPIKLRDGRLNPRLYLALYDIAEYVTYHVIYSGEKRVDKDEIYFMKNTKHRVSAVKLGPESCDLLSYGKIEAEKNEKIEDIIRTHWLIGQAFNRPVICDNQLCSPTATYLRIYDEHTGTFRTYSIAITTASPHITNENIEEPPSPFPQHLLKYRKTRLQQASLKLITYNPATDKLEPHVLKTLYINTCRARRTAVPGPHLLLYGPAINDNIVAAPLTCSCPGAENEQCSRTMYYHAPILALALLTATKEKPATRYTKLAKKAYKIMESGESNHLSYKAIIEQLIEELGTNYRLLDTTLEELQKNTQIARRPIRKGEKLLSEQLKKDCKIVL